MSEPLKPEEITRDTFPKMNSFDLVRNMPNHLKDPANYEKIQKAILDAGATKHSHAEIEAWGKCSTCQRAQQNRLTMMKGLGFDNGKQYLEWRKIHEHIRLHLNKASGKEIFTPEVYTKPKGDTI